METTTGMSPPPIEATRCHPNASAIAVITSSGTTECEATNHTSRPVETSTAARLSQCRAGSISGDDLMRALSLRKATIEPVNVTAPMNTPRKTSTLWIVASEPVRPSALR